MQIHSDRKHQCGRLISNKQGGGGEETRIALRHHVHVALARRDIAAGILDAILEHLRLIPT